MTEEKKILRNAEMDKVNGGLDMVDPWRITPIPDIHDIINPDLPDMKPGGVPADKLPIHRFDNL